MTRRRALRQMGNEKPAARARRLAWASFCGYSARYGDGQPPDGAWALFEDGFVRGYRAAVEDMVDVDDERGG